jgi:hypothetical protein
MRLTNMARQELETYLAEVRRSLDGRSDLNASDVVAGIREHVETELSMRSVETVTAEDVVEVLEGLGPPTSLAENGTADGDGTTAKRTRTAAIAALVLAGAGIALIPTAMLPLGWTLIAASLVTARLVLPAVGPVQSVEGRLVLAMWHTGVGCAAAALLFGPAVLVWGAAQIGGVLEGPLTSHLGIEGSARPAGYWATMAAAAGMVTGVWWLLLGVLVRRSGDALRRTLGPARWAVPARSSRALLITGAVVSAVSLLGGLL